MARTIRTQGASVGEGLRAHARARLLGGLVPVVVAGLCVTAAGGEAYSPAPGSSVGALERAHQVDSSRAGSQRPPDGGSNGSKWNRREAKRSPVCTRKVCIHWAGRGRDAPLKMDGDRRGKVPGFVQLAKQAAQRSYRVQVGELDWRKPPRDKKRSGTKQIDFFFSDIKDFGFIAADPGRGVRRSSFAVIDNDFKGFDPVPSLQVTIAHEFNHILQFGYDYYSQPWHDESVANYMEDRTYPEINDYVGHVQTFADNPRVPLTKAGGKEYGSAIFNQFLASGFGDGVIERTWALAPSVDDISAAAYEKAIAEAGGGGFAEQFVAFSAETAAIQASDRFPDAALLPDVERAGGLAPGEIGSGSLDNSAMVLFEVEPSGGQLTLDAVVPAGLDAGIALVGLRGDPVSGAVEQAIETTDDGGHLQVSLGGAPSFDRITAVLVNADVSARQNQDGEVVYMRDDQRFDYALSG